MKITYVMMQYPLPTQTFAISDIATLRSHGHTVTVECLLPSTKAQRELVGTYELDGNTIRNASIPGYLSGVVPAIRYVFADRPLFAPIFRELARQPKRLLIFLLLLPRIAQLVRNQSRQPSDVVHAFWGHWPSVVPALLSRYAPSIRTSMHMGAYDLDVGFPLRLTAERVDDCFTHSTSNLPRITEMGVRPQVHMIHRGIPLNDLSDRDVEGHPIEKRRLQFCTASALVKEKHVDVSLRLFAAIKRKHPEATLVIAGDGPERVQLEKLADDLDVSDAVTFAGYVKRQDLFRIMCASESFLFFSTKPSERLPNVVKEAMLAKCVCFVSPTLGIEELVPSDDYGIVFGDISEEAIADRIVKVIADEACSRSIGQSAQALVTSQFSSDAAMTRYAQIWSGPSSRGLRSAS